MKLSRLDEGRSTLDFETLDLYTLANTVCERLYDRAVQHEVSLSVHGASCMIYGVPIMVDEVLSNLCDNAIKYNRPNGTVEVTLEQEHTQVILSVSNTGPAIPPMHKHISLSVFIEQMPPAHRKFPELVWGFPSSSISVKFTRHLSKSPQSQIIRFSAFAGPSVRSCTHDHTFCFPLLCTGLTRSHTV